MCEQNISRILAPDPESRQWGLRYADGADRPVIHVEQRPLPLRATTACRHLLPTLFAGASPGPHGRSPNEIAQQQINLAIKAAFEERHIDFAYPTQLLYLANNVADGAGLNNGNGRQTVPAAPS